MGAELDGKFGYLKALTIRLCKALSLVLESGHEAEMKPKDGGLLGN